MEDFFTSTEFYVLAITCGALLFAFFVKPTSKGEAFSYFFMGYKQPSLEVCEDSQLLISGNEDGSLKLIHTSVIVSQDAHVSLAVEVRGNDIKIVEKIEDNQLSPIEEHDVTYNINCVKSQRYHLFFESTHTGMWASSTFYNSVDFHARLDFKY